MENLFTDLIEWMADVPPLWAYLIILVIAYGENVVPPIPGDLVVVFGGYLVGLGKLDFGLVVLLATLGGAAGFMTMYAVGARVGRAVLQTDRYRWLPRHYMVKAQAWLHRWGYGVIAANRFLSGARSVISLTVGMSHMDVGRTVALSTLSAAVWTTVITYAGYKVGENWEVVSVYLRQYGQLVLVLLVGLGLLQIIRSYRARKRSEKDEPASG